MSTAKIGGLAVQVMSDVSAQKGAVIKTAVGERAQDLGVDFKTTQKLSNYLTQVATNGKIETANAEDIGKNTKAQQIITEIKNSEAWAEGMNAQLSSLEKTEAIIRNATTFNTAQNSKLQPQEYGGEVGLTEAESQLLNTPDAQLTPQQRTEKQSIAERLQNVGNAGIMNNNQETGVDIDERIYNQGRMDGSNETGINTGRESQMGKSNETIDGYVQGGKAEILSGGTGEAPRRIRINHTKNSSVTFTEGNENGTDGYKVYTAFVNAGIKAIYCQGPIERTANGVTVTRTEAFTAPDGTVYVSSESSLPAKQTFDHEKVHVADKTNNPAYSEYEAVLCDEVDYSSDAYKKVAEEINKNYFNGKYDIEDVSTYPIFMREIVAYINQFVLSDPEFAQQTFGGMFNDWGAVVEAVNKFNNDMKADFTESANFMPGNETPSSESGRAYDDNTHKTEEPETDIRINTPSKIVASPELKNIIDRLFQDENVSVEEIENIPQIKEVAEEAASRPETYTVNTPERQKLRRQVADKLLKNGSYSGVDENGKEVYNGDVKQEHRADIVIGLSAAGKSSVLVNPLSEMNSSRVIDSDMAKEELPEFDNGLGANAVHRESQNIIDQVLIESIKNGDNIVWPIVGGNKVNSLVAKIELLKQNGYSVYLHLNELSNNKALGRALNRYVETGRYIPPQVIKAYGNTPTQNFNKIINMEGFIDGYSHYSNDVERGQSPKFIKASENVGNLYARGQRGVYERTSQKVQGSRSQGVNSATTKSKNTEADTEVPANFMPENETTSSESGEYGLSEPSDQEIHREPTAEEYNEAMFGEMKNAKQRHILDVAKKLDSGMKVVFVSKDAKVLSGKNGVYMRESNTMYLSKDNSAVESYFQLFKHECIHRLESRGAYQGLKNYLFHNSSSFEGYARAQLKAKYKTEFKGTREEALQALAQLYIDDVQNGSFTEKFKKGFTLESAQHEMVADFISEILFKGNRRNVAQHLSDGNLEAIYDIEDTLSEFESLTETDRKWFEKIIDWIKDLIASFKGVNQNKRLVEDLEYIEKRLGRVFDSRDTKKAAKNSGGVMYCLRKTGANAFNPNAETLNEQLKDAYETSESFEQRYVYVGEFSTEFINLLQKNNIVLYNYPIAMNYRDAYLSMHSKETGKYRGQGINYHNLGVEGLQEALESFKNPKHIMKSKKDGKIELALQTVDKKGNSILSIIAINTVTLNGNKMLDAHIVTSAYGKKNIEKYILTAKNEGRIIENKTEEIPQGTPQVQYEGSINEISSNDIILDEEDDVKNNISNETQDYSDSEENGEGSFSLGSPAQQMRDNLKKYESGEITKEEYLEETDRLWGEANETYGMLPQGENAKAPIATPRAVAEDKPTKRFTRTIIETGTLTDEMLEGMEEKVLLGDFSYEVISDEKALEKADKAVGNGTAEDIWEDTVNGKKVNKTEIAETALKENKPLTNDEKNHDFAKDGFEYRTAYFEDFDGQYYKIRFSIGHNGTFATVYNVGKIKEDVPSSAKIIAVVGSRALDGSSSNDIILNNEPTVNNDYT